MSSVGEELQRRGLTDPEVLELFRKAQQNLIGIVERSSSGRFQAVRQQQIRELEREIAILAKKLKQWSKQEIPRIVRAGADETLEKIEAFDESDFGFKFAGVSDKAIRALTEQAAMEFGNTLIMLKRNSERAMMNKALLQQKIRESVVQGSSVVRTQTELMDVLKNDGIAVLRTSNGRNLSLLGYTNTLVRSQQMSAYNTGARLQMLAAGRRFAIFPKIVPDIDGNDVCNEWEKKKYIDLKRDPLPPFSTHPNCRHTPIPVSFAQLKRERPDLYAIAVRDFRAAAE